MRSFLLKVGKVCVITAATVSLVYLGQPTMNSARASDMTVVSIKGMVSGPGGTLIVGATVSGTPDSLSGVGFDNGAGPGSATPGSPKGYCRFPLTGSLTGGVVTLNGTVAFSNVPSAVGTPVSFTAVQSTGHTGSITFNFGGFIFTGSGSVVVTP